jgi:hypothetical protein
VYGEGSVSELYLVHGKGDHSEPHLVLSVNAVVNLPVVCRG